MSPRGSTKGGLSLDSTAVQAVLLAGPTLLCLRIGLDPNAVAAVGYFPLAAFAVFPALAVGSGLARKGYGALPVLLCFLASAVLLSVVGIWVDVWARNWAPDCNLNFGDDNTTAGFDENREDAFDQPARHEVGKFYAACLHALHANVSGWPVEAQRARFQEMTVWHCPGYAALAASELTYQRLEARETAFGCAGLCFPRAPIWTPYYEQAPACGPILSNFLVRTVARTGMQAAVWGMLLVVGACFWAFLNANSKFTGPQVVRV